MAKVVQLTLPKDKRVICISDIHGSLDLFRQLLEKVAFSPNDILILLGDLFLKGTQCHDTLKFIINLAQNANVHVIRGNCDVPKDYVSDAEAEWLENLPTIIETQDYIFVHGGLTSNDLTEQNARKCMKYDAFLEEGLIFDKYVVTGHWPTENYCQKIPSDNPIVDEESRIISIDGGMAIKSSGQLNAFMISGDTFSFDFVDGLPIYQLEKPQAARGGNINITWNDRFIEVVEAGDETSLFKHIATGMTLSLPNSGVWIDDTGALSYSTGGTDYYLPVNAGDTVSVIKRFGKKLFAKKDGVCGWLDL